MRLFSARARVAALGRETTPMAEVGGTALAGCQAGAAGVVVLFFARRRASRMQGARGMGKFAQLLLV